MLEFLIVESDPDMPDIKRKQLRDLIWTDDTNPDGAPDDWGVLTPEQAAMMLGDAR